MAHLIRGNEPRSRPRHARRSDVTVEPREKNTRGRRGGQTAGGSDQRRRDAGQPRTGSTLRRATANPTGVAEFRNEPGQAAITARTASPVRAPKERRPRMTRAGGVSTNTQRNHRRREAPKTARASSKFASPTWASAMRDANQRRSGMVRRPVASETRNGAAGERRRDATRETSREVADRPVRRERGGRQPTPAR
jgi:hypothetical protein